MKQYKGYVIGILIGASLMLSAQSFAEDGLTEIKALLRTGLNITLDGAKVELDNPSINYNGSTYIKLRDAGKLTGTGVVWNEKTQTVEMSSVGTSQDKVDTVTSTAVKNEATVSPSPLTQITPAPTPNVSPFPDADYTSLENIVTRINNQNYSFKYNESSKDYSLVFKDGSVGNIILINNIPTKVFDHRSYINEAFFLNRILPLIR